MITAPDNSTIDALVRVVRGLIEHERYKVLNMIHWWEIDLPDANAPALVRAVAYFRHSAQDRQENSIPIQQDQVRAWAKQHGVEIIREFCDAGRSGLNSEGRPAFTEMMDEWITYYRITLNEGLENAFAVQQNQVRSRAGRLRRLTVLRLAPLEPNANPFTLDRVAQT